MAKDENKRYAALEITSSAIRLVYGYAQDGKVYVLHALESRVSALENSYVIDQDLLANAIRGLVTSVNETLKIKIKSVILALPPVNLLFCRESSTTTTIGTDNVVVQIDIINAISQLKKYKFSEGLKIVDVVPYKYILDNKEYSNVAPIGKVSQTLTVNASIFAMEEELVKTYLEAVEKAGLHVRQAVVAPYATSLYMATEEDIPSSYYLLNIGSENTTLTQVAQNSLIMQNTCIKFGSDMLTSELSTRLGVSFKEANMLKEKYGLDHSPSFKVSVYQNIELDDIYNGLIRILDPLAIAIKTQIDSWNNKEQQYLPLIITGGGCKLYGLKSFLEQKLGINVLDYTPYSLGARDKAYQTCLGLISYADVHLSNEEENELSISTISRTDEKVNDKKRYLDYDIDEEL